ncbi:hypothetical protein [Natronomonas sp. EA1]|uniref:hypothetical protein n=1 Tax=Natronomonas sp. EA1 TaxID=3421655 RepID=UPI003EBB7798
MAFYLVRATPTDELDDLAAWLETDEIDRMRPFGNALASSLRDARVDPETGEAVWEEEDYCTPPLRQERAAVLDDYFTDIRVERVKEGEGWAEIESYPELFSPRPIRR